MFTKLHHQYPLPSWAAIVAALVVICWPAAVQANCCCKRAERALVAFGLETNQTDSCLGISENSASCCCTPKNVRAQPIVASASASCCSTLGGLGSSPDSNTCSCLNRCCADMSCPIADGNPKQRVKYSEILDAIQTQRSLDFVCLTLAMDIHYTCDLAVGAQERCAQICRWLK